MQKLRGFTLVELIVVVLLVAILSAYAASRFLGVSSFSAFAAQDQAISIIRQIQVSRMQSNLSDVALQTNSYYVLAVQPGCLGSVAACALNQDDSRSDVLRGNQLSFSSSVVLTNQRIQFDLLGNPKNEAASGVTITISAPGSSAAVCINTQGYVARGNCL
ncbi:GspH/FimT family pseudopilin [Vibrio fluvialis]|uniref:MSHA pilin protein MshC n=1 Tax=Vibrio fluvialis PG41 TaxID=1336752 RepID=S7HVI7_VIBFL|nr:GspH/FimT family pseudopilin [Vibrio fluvialis]EKO3438813.1 prepilin-type N-terminal cleavage/methylation domain-containing protein [Vibrio fluvialis]EKO3469276.1 prepilin-type N-terminal cleavage/methylation domain-containing protein [Vibrio fluvialis]EPP19683.1 MSHA pilin protein MshC [Vibrio fluvialis PG41]MBL4262409.1 prepilin-type N-terminal cleavage/methylation domain-containing protein [Vibrio fluvialis]MBY7873221.1 prepilin-type N-terminal cleavage/methylation domain-containing prot